MRRRSTPRSKGRGRRRRFPVLARRPPDRSARRSAHDALVGHRDRRRERPDARAASEGFDRDVDSRSLRGVFGRIADEVRNDLSQSLLVSDHDDRCRRAEGDHESGRDDLGLLCGLFCDHREIDGVLFERPTLIQAGEEQQVVDEHSHPGRFVLDPPHRRGEVVGACGGPASEELGIAADRGDRGSELVGGVSEELTQPVLRSPLLGECTVDLGEHLVQGCAEATDLGAVVVALDTTRKVTRRDRPRRLLDPSERPHPDSHDEVAGERQHGEHDRGDKEVDGRQTRKGRVKRLNGDRDDRIAVHGGLGVSVERRDLHKNAVVERWVAARKCREVSRATRRRRALEPRRQHRGWGNEVT